MFWVQGAGSWSKEPVVISPKDFAVPGAPLAASQQFGADQSDVFLVDKSGQLNLFWAEGKSDWSGPSITVAFSFGDVPGELRLGGRAARATMR
jgi:hypothetical protein